MASGGRLEGRVAIVTGGGSGIGQAIAVRFAREGARVVIADISGRRAGATLALIHEAGGEGLPVKGDIRRWDAITAMVEAAMARFDRIDVLVNNAGTIRPGDAVELAEEDWDLVLDTNLKAPFLCAKAVIPQMRSQGSGAIVNIASISGLAGDRENLAYSAAKAGLINLTRSLAVDHAADGIRANCICPGVIASPPIQWLYADPAERARVAGLHPLGRMGEPDEVARLALFLASDDASFMTGSAVVIDGGVTAQSPMPRPGGAPRPQGV